MSCNIWDGIISNTKERAVENILSTFYEEKNKTQNRILKWFPILLSTTSAILSCLCELPSLLLFAKDCITIKL